MLLYHPEVAAVPCSECQRWIYGKDWKPALRGGRKQARGPGQATPCMICPKKSPENAKQLELTPQAHRTIQLYLRHRATGSALTKAEAKDAYLVRNFGIIDVLFREWERVKQGEQIEHAFLGIF